MDILEQEILALVCTIFNRPVIFDLLSIPSLGNTEMNRPFSKMVAKNSN